MSNPTRRNEDEGVDNTNLVDPTDRPVQLSAASDRDDVSRRNDTFLPEKHSMVLRSTRNQADRPIVTGIVENPGTASGPAPVSKERGRTVGMRPEEVSTLFETDSNVQVSSVHGIQSRRGRPSKQGNVHYSIPDAQQKETANEHFITTVEQRYQHAAESYYQMANSGNNGSVNPARSGSEQYRVYGQGPTMQETDYRSSPATVPQDSRRFTADLRPRSEGPRNYMEHEQNVPDSFMLRQFDQQLDAVRGRNTDTDRSNDLSGQYYNPYSVSDLEQRASRSDSETNGVVRNGTYYDHSREQRIPNDYNRQRGHSSGVRPSSSQSNGNSGGPLGRQDVMPQSGSRDSNYSYSQRGNDSFTRRPNFKGRSKPPTFSGKFGDWKMFRSLFLQVSSINQWDEQEQLFNLMSNLEGEARSFVSSLDFDTSSMTVHQLLKLMDDRFGSGRNQQHYETLLDSKSWNLNQDPREYADEIRRLVALAYPTCPSDYKEILVKRHFVGGIHETDLRQQLVLHTPKTLEHVVEFVERWIAMNAISNCKLKGTSSRPMNHAIRMVGPYPDSDYEDDDDDSDAESDFEDTIKFVSSKHKSFYREGRPSYREGKPSYRDGKPSYRDGKPSYREGKPSYRHGQSYTGDYNNKPRYDNSRNNDRSSGTPFKRDQYHSPGHKPSVNWKQSTGETSTPNRDFVDWDVKCFFCQGNGHYKNECPSFMRSQHLNFQRPNQQGVEEANKSTKPLSQ